MFSKMEVFLALQTIIVVIPAALSAGIPVNHLHHFIESPKLSHWGEWGKLEHCPSDQVVIGMRLKVHENQGMKDDTGLNAVKFYCQNPYSTAEYTSDIISITSLIGKAGEWKKEFFCPVTPDGKQVAVGFQLRSESATGVKDDTAANDLRLICSDLYQKKGFTNLDGDGTARGTWTKQQLCNPGYAICGLATQVEMASSLDTTGLNNMKVRCCKADGSVIFNATNSANNSVSDDSKMKEITSTELHHRSSVFAEGNQDVPDEVELIAYDPEPTDFLNEPYPPATLPTGSDSQVHESEEQRQLTTSNINEDDTLPEAIASIDQVDNSEAQDDGGKPETSSFEHNIPHDVANALEDADSPTGTGEEHEEEQTNSEDEASKNISDEDFSLYTNYKESMERTNFHMQDSDESSELFDEQKNTLHDQAEANPKAINQDQGHLETLTNGTAKTAASTGSRISNWQALGIGYFIMLVFVKLV